MRTVFATSYTPSLDSGRARRTYAVSRALAALGPLEIVYGAFGADRPDPAFEQIEGARLHRIERPGSSVRLPSYAAALIRGVPPSFARGIWPQLARRALTLADNARLVADGPVAAAALLPACRRREVIYNAHNLESSFRHRLAEDATAPSRLRRFERRLLTCCSESWMVSPADIEGAATLAPQARLRLVPNVVDVAAIEPVPARSGQQKVLFVADFAYEPNRGALRFLLAEAMPALWRRRPEARLVVAGKGSDAFDGHASVDLLGFVPDLRALYESAGCVVVPLLEGGGSPLKFVEALAYGMPIVATPKAAAGLDVRAGIHFAEAPPEGELFSQQLDAVLDPPMGNPLGKAARELAERDYSIEALQRRLSR